MREAAQTLSAERRLGAPHKLKAKLALLAEMLAVAPWSRLPLTLAWATDAHLSLLSGTRPLPAHVDARVVDLCSLPTAANVRAGTAFVSGRSARSANDTDARGALLDANDDTSSDEDDGDAAATLECNVCEDFIYDIGHSLAVCEREPQCAFVAHIVCLADIFLRREARQAAVASSGVLAAPPGGGLLPRGGECPLCRAPQSWKAIVEHSKQIRSRLAERRALPSAGRADCDSSAPQSPAMPRDALGAASSTRCNSNAGRHGASPSPSRPSSPALSISISPLSSIAPRSPRSSPMRALSPLLPASPRAPARDAASSNFPQPDATVHDERDNKRQDVAPLTSVTSGTSTHTPVPIFTSSPNVGSREASRQRSSSLTPAPLRCPATPTVTIAYEPASTDSWEEEESAQMALCSTANRSSPMVALSQPATQVIVLSDSDRDESESESSLSQPREQVAESSSSAKRRRTESGTESDFA